MNSKSIQEKHSQFYQDLFAKCEIVCSTPIGINWGIEYSMGYGGLGLMQKLPLRVYVGIEKINVKDKSDMIHCQIYVPESDEFVPYTFDKQVYDNMNSIIKYLNIQGNFRFHIISEYYFERGLLAWSSMTTALSTALFLLNDKLTVNQVYEFSKLKDQLIDKNETTRNTPEIRFLDFIYMINIAFSWTSNGGNLLAFFQGPEMFVYHAMPISEELRSFFKEDFKIDPERINKIDYSFISLNKIAPFKNTYPPFDFQIFYSGKERTPVDILYRLLPSNFDATEIDNFFQKYKKTLLLDKPDRKFQEKLDFSSDQVVKIYQKLANYLSYEILSDFVLLSQDHNSNLKYLFKDLNNVKKIIELFDLIDQPIADLLEDVMAWGRSKLDDKFACRSLYKTDFMILAEKNTLKLQNRELINYLDNEGYLPITNIYNSWDDGTEERGIVIEQFLSQNIKSNLFKLQPAKGFEYENGKIISRNFNLNEIEKVKNNSDIFIDCNDMKIYFKGHLLNSKELRSAVKTIILLRALLKSNGQVRPNELDLNSYADRNEMQSKIITPLEKMALKYLKRKLYVEATGGIATNYTIKFDPGSLVINVLEEVL